MSGGYTDGTGAVHFIRDRSVPFIIIIAEVAIALGVVLYLQSQQAAFCGQLQHSRVVSNRTLRAPFRQFALDAAATRTKQAPLESDPAKRRIDLEAAANYRRVGLQVKPLPPLKC